MTTEIQSSINPTIHKPKKVVVPLAVGLAWGNDPDYLYSEKMDGRFAIRHWRGATLAGEEMADGRFVAFDLLAVQDDIDLRPHPFAERWGKLMGVAMALRADGMEVVRSSRNGGAFLREVLARGGEGVVRKRLDAPWGTVMEACKRLETFTCIVTGFNAGQSVQISRIDGYVDDWIHAGKEVPPGSIQSSIYPAIHLSSTEPCGNVALLGGKCDRVRVGSILKIEGFGLTREGKIRESRVDKDSPTSWLIQY